MNIDISNVPSNLVPRLSLRCVGGSLGTRMTVQRALPLVLEQVREQIFNDSFVPVVSLYKTTHEMLVQLFVGVVYTQLLQAV